MVDKETKKQTIVFVHGAWHGAWCWDTWQQYFNEQGYNAIAVDLRGHGSKSGSYKRARMVDYVEDVEIFLKQFEEPPILIGHSMGCKIVQHIISKAVYPSAVLVAPVPSAKQFRRVFVRQMVSHPRILLRSLATRNMKAWVSSRKSAELFFSDKLEREAALTYLGKMQGESFDLFLIDILFKSEANNQGTPLLLVAPEYDAFFSVDKQRQTAQNLGADFMIAYDSGHDVMLDVPEAIAANSIGSWIQAKSFN